MNYILYLTQNCNLRCKYCYENKKNEQLSFEDIKLLIDNEIEKKSNYCVLTFYGGEPLLRKDLIYKIIDYIKSTKCKTKFYYGMTTNGTLLDKEFIEYIKKNDFLNIAYSFDGMKETQNLNRVTIKGEDTFDVVEKNAKELLKNYYDVIAMVVVTKNNINRLSENVEYLLSLGFKKINLLFDYLYDWQDEDLTVIKEQYTRVGQIYYDKISKEEDIDITVFDEKIKTYIKDDYNCNGECDLGIKTINVDTEGNFYPCIQLVGNHKYIIGDCKNGIDFDARKKLIEEAGKENEICKTCAINRRCKHTCACKNYITTKDINELAPIVCEFEKMIIEISDEIAEKLYKEDSKLFIQKFYNKNYGLFKEIINKERR